MEKCKNCCSDNKIIEEVNALNVFQKLKVYIHYFSTMTALKKNFIIVDKKRPNWQNGYGNPDEHYLGIAIFHPWISTPILEYDDFASEFNIKTIDIGENWEKQGFAQRYRTEIFGIYEWYIIYSNSKEN